MKTSPTARERFLERLRSSVHERTLIKLTLGKHRGADTTLRNLFVRPVRLKAGPHLTFVWRHETRDITKNHVPEEALARIDSLLGADFLDAHLFTITQTLQFEGALSGPGRLSIKQAATADAPDGAHDRPRHRPLAQGAGWLHALGVTNERGQPREGQAGKFRQIQKFSELVDHLIDEAGLEKARGLKVADMGCGKGYLTFAAAALLGPRAAVTGIEVRPDLVELCNRVAAEHGFNHLRFVAGDIASTEMAPVDVLVALHACDTATDDALSKGITAGATLLIVSPCCQKELRPQLIAPPVLAGALRHGIFQERQAEFVTDALRAQLLEWAGYRTKVFEFVSTEHTAKNLMIAGIKTRPRGDAGIARAIRDFAAFYGIRRHRLADQLGFPLGQVE